MSLPNLAQKAKKLTKKTLFDFHRDAFPTDMHATWVCTAKTQIGRMQHGGASQAVLFGRLHPQKSFACRGKFLAEFQFLERKFLKRGVCMRGNTVYAQVEAVLFSVK